MSVLFLKPREILPEINTRCLKPTQPFQNDSCVRICISRVEKMSSSGLNNPEPRPTQSVGIFDDLGMRVNNEQSFFRIAAVNACYRRWWSGSLLIFKYMLTETHPSQDFGVFSHPVLIFLLLYIDAITAVEAPPHCIQNIFIRWDPGTTSFQIGGYCLMCAS